MVADGCWQLQQGLVQLEWGASGLGRLVGKVFGRDSGSGVLVDHDAAAKQLAALPEDSISQLGAALHSQVLLQLARHSSSSARRVCWVEFSGRAVGACA